MFMANPAQVSEDYVVRVELMPSGKKSDIIVLDRNSMIQVATHVTPNLVSVAISALISDLRQYAGDAGLCEDSIVKRHDRVNAALTAATLKFASERSGESWLLTPRAAFGFKSAHEFAASTEEGLNLVLAQLAEEDVHSAEQRGDEGSHELFTAILSGASDARPHGVDVLRTVLLKGADLMGNRAWLIATPDAKVSVVMPGATTPQQAEAALLEKREEYENLVENLDAFIKHAQQLGAFSEPASEPKPI